MNVWVHNETKGMYFITGKTKEDGQVVIKYERYGDGMAATLTGPKFNRKFRPATNEELTALGKVVSVLKATGTPARTDRVIKMASEVKPDTLAETPEELEVNTVGILVHPTEEHDFSRIIVHESVQKSIEMGLAKLEKAELLEKVFGMKTAKGRCIMNFFGPPGTGKTLTAMALARHLNKQVYQVDYSQMISKYVGDTGKHLKAAFMEATRLDAVLFFDEADAMLSKRISMQDAGETNSINQNRNILMQELDRYQGIMITATNFFHNYDEAILRRIAQHVKFDLPTAEMRTKILEIQFPKVDNITADLSAVAKAAIDFSGSDIKTLSENAALNAVVTMGEAAKISTEMLMQELKRIAESKQAHRNTRKG